MSDDCAICRAMCTQEARKSPDRHKNVSTLHSLILSSRSEFHSTLSFNVVQYVQGRCGGPKKARGIP